MITGYKLREAIKQQQLRLDATERVLSDSYKAFPGEQKTHPAELIQQIEDIERRIARLQTAQVSYNLVSKVMFEGQTLSLAEAIKVLGGLSRVEKAWRKATGGKEERNIYGRDNKDERDPAKQYAAWVVSPNEAIEKSLAAAKRTAELRGLIAVANAREPAAFEEIAGGVEEL
jgi:hypothetical protein